MTRFDAGYLHPINQALFFADVYSQGGDSTWFYQIDLDGNITRQAMALRRDEQRRIDQLQVGDEVYRFKLNEADNVIAYSLVDGNAGITVSAISGDVTEAGGEATFTVVLNSQPTHDVTIALHSSDTTEGTISPSTLTFTPGNWNMAQPGTVTGVDDLTVDGDQDFFIITNVAVSQDLNYDGFDPTDVTVTNVDDDVPRFTLSKTVASVSESGTRETFTLVLDAQPLSNVVFDLTSANTGEVTVNPAQVTFTSANWNTAVTITVTGVNDSPPVVDGPQTVDVSVAVNAAASDDAWEGLAIQTVTVTNQDNDAAGLTLSKTTATVSENGTSETFPVVLDAQPLSNVVFDLASANTGEVTVTPAQVTFTSANWNTAVTITVTGVNDAPPVVDGPQTVDVSVAVNAAGSDDAWDNLASRTVIVTNQDNDGPASRSAKLPPW